MQASQLTLDSGKDKRLIAEVKLAAYHTIDDTARLLVHQAVVTAYTETELSLHAEGEGTAAADELTEGEQAEDMYGFVLSLGGYAKFREKEMLGMAALAAQQHKKKKRKRKKKKQDELVDEAAAVNALHISDFQGPWSAGSVLIALHEQPVRVSSQKDAQGIWMLKAGVKVRVEHASETELGMRLLVNTVPSKEQNSLQSLVVFLVPVRTCS